MWHPPYDMREVCYWPTDSIRTSTTYAKLSERPPYQLLKSPAHIVMMNANYLTNAWCFDRVTHSSSEPIRALFSWLWFNQIFKHQFSCRYKSRCYDDDTQYLSSRLYMIGSAHLKHSILKKFYVKSLILL